MVRRVGLAISRTDGTRVARDTGERAARAEERKAPERANAMAEGIQPAKRAKARTTLGMPERVWEDGWEI